MNIYSFTLSDLSPAAIDDVNNGILLRRDLHIIFDQKVFRPVAKAGKVVSHYLERTKEMRNLYHNADIRMPGTSPPVQFLGSRFAWWILPHVGNFKDRLRLIGRISVEENNEVSIAAATKQARKHDETSPRRSKRLRARRGRGRCNEGRNDN